MEIFKPRFRVKRRRPFGEDYRAPWVLKDRERPAFVGQYATFALAIEATDRIAAAEWQAAVHFFDDAQAAS